MSWAAAAGFIFYSVLISEGGTGYYVPVIETPEGDNWITLRINH